LLFGEFVFEGEESEELASWTVLEYKVEFFIILEAAFKFDEKGVMHIAEDAFFRHDVFLLILFNNVFFLEDFHRIDLLI